MAQKNRLKLKNHSNVSACLGRIRAVCRLHLRRLTDKAAAALPAADGKEVTFGDVHQSAEQLGLVKQDLRCRLLRGLPCRHRRPRYDPVLRKLWVGDVCVLHYKRPAPCQTAILEAFEACHWEAGTNNPLRKVRERKGVARLKRAVFHLNGGQKLVLFHASARGLAVTWEFG